MMMQKPKISIVIPTKNEERTIQEIIEQSKKYGDEVLVIDGHSADHTRERATDAGARVILDNGLGKGAALRLGIKEASGDIIVFMDADCSHDPADIPKLIAPIVQGAADLVIGSRLKGGSDELGSTVSEVFRLYGGRLIALAINLRFGQNITDYLNGFRAIRTSVARGLHLRENQQTIEHEMAMECLRQGRRVIEVGAHEYKRRYGESHISLFRHGPRFVYILLKKLF